MDITVDPKLTSFIEVDAQSHFPIQNLPYGVFKPESSAPARVGVAIGDYVLDLSVLAQQGLLKCKHADAKQIFAAPHLNDFMALGQPAWRAVRGTLSDLLQTDNPTLRDNTQLRAQALILQNDVQMQLPVTIGDYTDFYSSKEHASNVGLMFRGQENPLLPNWTHMPVAYHGRASSVVVSGTNFLHPHGQVLPPDTEQPVYAPSQGMDFELEMGFLLGAGNQAGEPIPVDQAEQHIFGMVLVNDWSARDIQRWEYVPLGPFLSKSFCTTISPWVVSLDALAPFKVDAVAQDPQPLAYLQEKKRQTYDINLEVALRSPHMHSGEVICRSNFRYLYWTVAQQLAHHTVAGCNTNVGDLMASGTISGKEKHERGCLLELTWGGKEVVHLSNGEERRFLLDGDEIIMMGWCQAEGYRVGFGDAHGTMLAHSA